MKVSDVHLFSSWWIIDQFHSISPWLSMLPLPWLCAPHHCFRATGLHPHLYPRHKEELKELSKSENSIKYPCCAVAKAACSGFSNLEYSLIWLIYIHKHIRDKVNQYHFNSKVQHSQKIPTSSKRQSKKKKKLSKAQFLILKSFSPLRCFNKRSWKLNKSHFKLNLTIFL